MLRDLTPHRVNIADCRQGKQPVRSVTVRNRGARGFVPGRLGAGSRWPAQRRRLGTIPRVSTHPAVPGTPDSSVPPPLQVAAALAGVEAGALLLQGISLIPALEGQRLAMGLTSVLFFLAYGAGLAWCAIQLRRRRSWARSPVVFAQLIQLGVASSFWGGQTTYVAVVLVVVALIVLAGVFHPQSLRALDSTPD